MVFGIKLQKMKKTDTKKFMALIVLGIFLLPVLVILLTFILLLTPVAGLTFLGYTLIKTVDNIHRRNKNFKLKKVKNETPKYTTLANL